jgi:hypothetical protein
MVGCAEARTALINEVVLRQAFVENPMKCLLLTKGNVEAQRFY